MMLRRLALAALIALTPSLALAQVNGPDFSIAAYVRNALSGNVVIGGNLTVNGAIIDNTGGITLNNPTGGSQGAGTINVAGNYYKNGVAFGILASVVPGTGIAAALGVNVGSAGAPVLFNGAGGTPSSLVLTSATGLPTTSLTGPLQAAQEPAHTGGCTNSAGSLALSCQINTNFGMGHGGNCGGIAAASTAFFGPNGCFNATEATVQAPISAPITLKNFYVKSGVAPGGSDTFILTVRKNTADTTITCTISAAATTCSDLTHSVSYVAADLIDVKVVTSATAVTATFMTMSTAVTTTP